MNATAQQKLSPPEVREAIVYMAPEGELNISEMGDLVGVSGERVRQIMKSIPGLRETYDLAHATYKERVKQEEQERGRKHLEKKNILAEIAGQALESAIQRRARETNRPYDIAARLLFSQRVNQRDQREDVLEGIVCIIEETQQKARETGRPYDVALRYVFSPRRDFYNRNNKGIDRPLIERIQKRLEDVTTIVERATQALENGRDKTLLELVAGTEIIFSIAPRILSELGIESPTRDIYLLTDDSKARLLRCEGIKVTFADLSYFLGVSERGIGKYMQQKEINLERVFPQAKQRHFSFSMASKIYEAADAGFTRKEIVDYYHMHPDIIHEVLERKCEYAPIINDALNRLFPEREHKRRPYLPEASLRLLRREKGY